MKSSSIVRSTKAIRGAAGIVWVVILILVLAASLLSPDLFGDPKNLTNILTRLSILTVVALAQMLVVVEGSADLSVGFGMSFAGCVASYVLIENPILGLLLVFALGAGIGLVNGIGITKAGINPFAMTLGMMFVLRGVSLVMRPYTGGTIPEFLLDAWKAELFYLPLFPVIVTVISGASLLFLFTKTYLGIHILSAGERPEIARRSGVRTDRIKILAHVACGCLTMLAGLLLAFRIEGGSATFGESYMLLSFGAIVLGGTSLLGGTTNVIGILGACLVLTLVGNILNLFYITEPIQWAVTAIVLLIIMGIAGSLEKE